MSKILSFLRQRFEGYSYKLLYEGSIENIFCFHVNYLSHVKTMFSKARYVHDLGKG